MGDEGQQRCHGACSVGRPAIDKIARDWDAVARPQTNCLATSHHFSNTQIRDLAWKRSQLVCLRFEETGFVEVTLPIDEAERQAYRSVATPWEANNSSILGNHGNSITVKPGPVVDTYYYPTVPIVDEINTVIGYVRHEAGGYTYVRAYDIEGNQLWSEMIGEHPLPSDEIGNALPGLIISLGPGLVRSIATGALTRAIGSALTQAAIATARGISPQALKVTLTVLRSLRARAIVNLLRKEGKDVIANLGGEAGKEEIELFGANQISLNHQVRMGIDKRFIPRLIKEPAENIGKVFKPGTVDKVVSRKLDHSIDVDLVARGAKEVLRDGGELRMAFFSGSKEFGSRFEKALIDAGFKDVKNIGNAFFTAVK